jgi:hypothetical protein
VQTWIWMAWRMCTFYNCKAYVQKAVELEGAER